MKTRLPVWVWAVVPLVSVQAKPALELAVSPAGNEVEIRIRNKPLLVYAFRPDQFKPYVRELYTLRGENVVRDAPPDHLHHHGLMYAITVNGVNFWEEQTDPGVQKPIQLLARKTGTVKGFPQAGFTQLIHWVARTNRAVAKSASVALLLERRTLTLTVDESAEEVALGWAAEFEVGKGPGQVTLQGSEYQGLGLRLAAPFDRVAEFQNALGTAFTMPQARSALVAKWTSVSAVLNGRPVTVAVCGHPANENGDAQFFTMREPFAYLSATQALDKRPIPHRAGDKFRLRYLVLVYPEAKSAAFLHDRYQAWIKRGH